MAEKDGRYHVTHFKGFCGVTQGDCIYPTIFNITVDNVMCHWVTVMAEEEAVPEGLGWSIQ